MEDWTVKLLIILNVGIIMILISIFLKINLNDYTFSPEDMVKKNGILVYNSSFCVKTDYTLKWAYLSDSGSMKPTFEYGHNLVEINCKENDCDFKKGDIVSFRYDNKTLVHRIVDIKFDDTPKYLTKGDNDIGKIWIYKEEILGKVIAIIY